MTDIIQLMRKSDKSLMLAESTDIANWKNLTHNKTGLETFLQFNIAELQFKYMNSSFYTKIVCTSNTQLIKVLQAARMPQKIKMLKQTAFDGIRTHDTTSILTYDIVGNTYKTVSLKAWEILNFISITPQNVMLLDEVIRRIFKRNVQVDTNSLSKSKQKKAKK